MSDNQSPAPLRAHPLFALANELWSSRPPGAIALYPLSDMPDYMQADWLAVAEHVTAMLAQARADERERMAELAREVANSLTAQGDPCACGNGRVPITTYRHACVSYAEAIRAAE
jgi:hypothetical protein